jgi:hypothetical protein
MLGPYGTATCQIPNARLAARAANRRWRNMKSHLSDDRGALKHRYQCEKCAFIIEADDKRLDTKNPSAAA